MKSVRSKAMGKDIAGSLILKGTGILLSLLIVPMTIDFVNPTQYGIWLTLSSLIQWVVLLDAGMTLGFRNIFGEAVAKGKHGLARVYVSNAFFSLGGISLFLIVVSIILGRLVDWAAVLNVSEQYKQELQRVFVLLMVFFSIQLAMQVITAMLAAKQKVMYGSFMTVSGQALGLAVIILLDRMHISGNLDILVWILSGIPTFIMIFVAILLFFGKFVKYRPSLKLFKLKYTGEILGQGYKFFIITTSMLLIFQLMNVIISRNLGPDSVTEYNIAFKYYNLVYMLAVVVMNPVWSAFTNAYAKKDFQWLGDITRKLERISLLLPAGILLMYMVSQTFFHIWVGDSVNVSDSVNMSVAVYTLFLTWANIFMYLINGTGKITLQLIIYLGFAVVAYPVMNMLCSKYGIPGMMGIPILVYVLQLIFQRIQIHRLVEGRAKGIWNK